VGTWIQTFSLENGLNCKHFTENELRGALDVDAAFPWSEPWMHAQFGPLAATDKIEGSFLVIFFGHADSPENFSANALDQCRRYGGPRGLCLLLTEAGVPDFE